MIIEDQSASDPGGDAIGQMRAARDILQACAAEAGRLSQAMARLDGDVGAALVGATQPSDTSTLQRLDLLRQEAEGLARMLQLATSVSSPDVVIDREAILRSVPLAAQRARLTS